MAEPLPSDADYLLQRAAVDWPMPHPDETDAEYVARVSERLWARVEAHLPPPGMCPACAGYVACAHTCGE